MCTVQNVELDVEQQTTPYVSLSLSLSGLATVAAAG